MFSEQMGEVEAKGNIKIQCSELCSDPRANINMLHAVCTSE